MRREVATSLPTDRKVRRVRDPPKDVGPVTLASRLVPRCSRGDAGVARGRQRGNRPSAEQNVMDRIPHSGSQRQDREVERRRRGRPISQGVIAQIKLTDPTSSLAMGENNHATSAEWRSEWRRQQNGRQNAKSEKTIPTITR